MTESPIIIASFVLDSDFKARQGLAQIGDQKEEMGAI